MSKYTERLSSVEKSIEKSISIPKSINDRLSNIEIKLNKPEISKLLSDRISALENKKIKMDVPKSVLDRLVVVENLPSEIKPLNERLLAIEKSIEIPQELLSLFKTLTDRISTLESETVKIKSRVDSISEEEGPSVHSPSSTNSNSLVKL